MYKESEIDKKKLNKINTLHPFLGKQPDESLLTLSTIADNYLKSALKSSISFFVVGCCPYLFTILTKWQVSFMDFLGNVSCV